MDHMKFFFLAAAFIFCLNAIAQKNEVIKDSAKTKTELFNKTLLWIGKTWGTNSGKVISLRDEVNGIIEVNGGLKAVPKTDGFAVKGQTNTTLRITVEDGRVELKFEHTSFKWEAGTVWNFEDDEGGAQKEKWKTDVADEINELVASYKADFGK